MTDYVAKLGEIAERANELEQQQQDLRSLENREGGEPPRSPGTQGVSEDIKKHITADNIQKMVSQLTENPDTIDNLMGDIPTSFSQEMMNKVKSVVSPQQAEQLKKQMENSGVDIASMRSKMVQQRNELYGLTRGNIGGSVGVRNVVLIKVNRKLLIRELSSDRKKLIESIQAILKVKDITEMTLFPGITIFYDPNETIINSRMKKLTDIKIGGDVICVRDDGTSITEENFISLELKALKDKM